MRRPAPRTAIAAAAGFVALSLGCGPADPPRDPQPAATPPAAANPPAAEAPRAAQASGPRVVFLGDSLTAGLGLKEGEAYPALLQERITAAGLQYQVVNAGVSGDTSAGGLRRLEWALEGNPGDVAVLVVALGGNDALRGLPVEELRRNLSAIVEGALAKKAVVILAGMEAPPNFGPEYSAAFRGVYQHLARTYRVELVPFLLDGVAGLETMNQRDGIHPTSEGAKVVAENVWAVLRPVLEGRDKSK